MCCCEDMNWCFFLGLDKLFDYMEEIKSFFIRYNFLFKLSGIWQWIVFLFSFLKSTFCKNWICTKVECVVGEHVSVSEFFFPFWIIESHLTCNYMGTGYWKIRIIECSNYEISNYQANFTLVKIRIGRIRPFSSTYRKIRIIELRIIESWLYFNSANYF